MSFVGCLDRLEIVSEDRDDTAGQFRDSCNIQPATSRFLQLLFRITLGAAVYRFLGVDFHDHGLGTYSISKITMVSVPSTAGVSGGFFSVPDRSNPPAESSHLQNLMTNVTNFLSLKLRKLPSTNAGR